MSVDGKESWLENRAIELFEEIQRKNPHLSWNEIDELCYKQAEEDYMNQPEVDYKKMQEEFDKAAEINSKTLLILFIRDLFMGIAPIIALGLLPIIL